MHWAVGLQAKQWYEARNVDLFAERGALDEKNIQRLRDIVLLIAWPGNSPNGMRLLSCMEWVPGRTSRPIPVTSRAQKKVRFLFVLSLLNAPIIGSMGPT